MDVPQYIYLTIHPLKDMALTTICGCSCYEQWCAGFFGQKVLLLWDKCTGIHLLNYIILSLFITLKYFHKNRLFVNSDFAKKNASKCCLLWLLSFQLLLLLRHFSHVWLCDPHAFLSHVPEGECLSCLIIISVLGKTTFNFIRIC